MSLAVNSCSGFFRLSFDCLLEAMDWQLFGLSFITVFLAEIGDKSQLAAIALGGSSKSPRAVFFGSISALILTSILGVIAGGSVAQFLPERVLKAIAAIGFAVMALRILWPVSE
jgi:putative Ca2+/H+ antiporter (TMEM165/GDT1 family)